MASQARAATTIASVPTLRVDCTTGANPDSVKLYAPGVGMVAEKDLHGGEEVFHLVRTT